jgi:hypothetical protein
MEAFVVAAIETDGGDSSNNRLEASLSDYLSCFAVTP